MEILRKIFKIKLKKIKKILPTVENKNFVMQGGVRNYLGKTEEVNNAPRYWQSFHTSPKTELCYITDAEKKLLLDANLHGSLKDGKPNVGASGLLSYDGWGDASDGFGSSGSSSGGSSSGGSSSGGGGGNGNSSILSNVIKFITGGGFVGAAVRGIKKSVAKSKAKKEANVKMGLGTDRMSNYSTNQGVARQEGDGGSNNSNVAIPLIAATSPTTAEVSQATATDATQSTATDATNTTLLQNVALRKKKAKATGRSMTILTSSKGVTSDQGLTLGKKSLLGA